MEIISEAFQALKRLFDIYSWDYITLAIVLFVIALAFLVIKHFMRNKKLYRQIVGGFLIAYVVLIFMVTVVNRQHNSPDFGVSLIPFTSYKLMRSGQMELFRESMMNIAFFYPVGFLFGCMELKGFEGGKKWLIVPFCTAYSIIIEIFQFIFRLGWVETDDVIHNTLGCVIGMLAFIVLDYMTFNERRN